MRRLNGLLMCWACFAALLFPHFVSAQTDDTGSNSGASPTPGGAAIANYADLIRLIESTVNVDGWQSAGGNSTMMEFRNGVKINADGLIERFEASKIISTEVHSPTIGQTPALVSLESLGDWQKPTSLRWVSLSELDRQLTERKQDRASAAMEMLGGLYRIDYVAYDSVSKGWFLGGPSGSLVLTKSGDILNSETNLPPVLLEDLLTLAPHILGDKGEFGCSIDPDPKRLVESNRLVSTSAAMKSLARNPDRWVEGWRKSLGHQNAKVVGIPQDSPTGYALLIADAHMKRLAFDLEFRPLGLKSYWQEVETFGQSRSEMGLVRWWFSLSDHEIPMDPERSIYHLASSNVQVESEAQMLNDQGKQVVSPTSDPAADAYARSFTRNFAKLQREHPCFGRLRHIFDLSVALEIVKLEMEQGQGMPLNFLSNEVVQPHMTTAPKAIDSIASTHAMPNGTITAVISGGVSIHLKQLRSRVKMDRQSLRSVSFEESHNIVDTTLSNSGNGLEAPFWR